MVEMITERIDRIKFWALFFAFFSAPFGNMHIGTLPLPHLALLIVLVVFLLGLVISFFSPSKDDEIRFVSGGYLFLAVLFFMVTILSLLINTQSGYHHFILYKGWIYLFKPLLLEFIVIVIVIPTLVSSREQYFKFIPALLLGYVITSLLCFAGFFQTHTLLAESDLSGYGSEVVVNQCIPFEWHNFSPLYPNRNVLGEILLPGLIFVVWYYSHRRRRELLWLMGVMFLLCLGSQSKMTYLGLIILSIVLLMNMIMHRKFTHSVFSSFSWIRMKTLSGGVIFSIAFLYLFFLMFFFILPKLSPNDSVPVDFFVQKNDSLHGKFSANPLRNLIFAEKYKDFLNIDDQELSQYKKRVFEKMALSGLSYDEIMTMKNDMSHSIQSGVFSEETQEFDQQTGFDDGFRDVAQHIDSMKNRALQYNLALDSLLSDEIWYWPLVGRGLRTWQYHLNNYKVFTDRYGRFYNYGFQIDAHGILPKVALEQGWLGLIILFLIVSFFSMHGLSLCSRSILNYQNGLPGGFLILVPVASLSFLFLGTNYYQPVNWLPIGLAAVGIYMFEKRETQENPRCSDENK